MQKTAISAFLLALVAFVSFSSVGADVDMINVIDLLSDFVKVDDNTINTLLDNNKLSQADRKNPNMAKLVKLLEKISKVDWKSVDKYVQVNHFTFDGTLSVDGKKVAIPKMFHILERVSKINWLAFSALFSSIPSVPRTPTSPSKAEGIDLPIINKRLERISRIDWSTK